MSEVQGPVPTEGTEYESILWTEKQWWAGVETPVLVVKTGDYEGPDRRQHPRPKPS